MVKLDLDGTGGKTEQPNGVGIAELVASELTSRNEQDTGQIIDRSSRAHLGLVLEQNNFKAAIARTQLEPTGENRDWSDGCWRTKPD
jgi:hypothetical protein